MYRDATGQPWSLAIDLPAARRVRDLANVNLLTLRVDALVMQLADPITLCEVLWASAKPEADAAGLDLDAFLRRMAVDLDAIASQLLEELACFFRKLNQTNRAIQTAAAAKMLTTMPEMTTAETETLLMETASWMVARARTLIASSGTAATSGLESPA